MPTSLILRSIEILVACVIVFSSGWILRGWKDGNQAYQGVIESVQTQQKINKQSSDQYESQATEQQKKSELFNEKSKIEVVEKPVYNECVIPDSGMQLLNSAVDSTNKIRPTP